jgi:hypothetical protein
MSLHEISFLDEHIKNVGVIIIRGNCPRGRRIVIPQELADSIEKIVKSCSKRFVGVVFRNFFLI